MNIYTYLNLRLPSLHVRVPYLRIFICMAILVVCLVFSMTCITISVMLCLYVNLTVYAGPMLKRWKSIRRGYQTECGVGRKISLRPPSPYPAPGWLRVPMFLSLYAAKVRRLFTGTSRYFIPNMVFVDHFQILLCLSLRRTDLLISSAVSLVTRFLQRDKYAKLAMMVLSFPLKSHSFYDSKTRNLCLSIVSLTMVWGSKNVDNIPRELG